MIFDVNKQLNFKPEILNPKPLNFDNVIVGGMGGSALPARAVFYLDPVYPLWLHNDYRLPKKLEGKPLFVAISYSGNTAETISFAKEAREKNLSLVVIISGGVLKDFAEKENISHILVPERLEPRDALVYMLKALLLLLGRAELLEELEKVRIDAESIDKEAEKIADFVSNGETLIYSSQANSVLGYIWKIFLNESAKMLAFCNYFPELAHNELESLNGNHRIVLLSDGNDNQESKNEMKVFLKLSQESGWNAREILFDGNWAENFVKNFVLARCVARKIAESKGVDPDKVPIVEEFKKKLK